MIIGLFGDGEIGSFATGVCDHQFSQQARTQEL
jgi:hypothetical protein